MFVFAKSCSVALAIAACRRQLSTTELNNSVEDYNSLRVGVVCLSPNLNMGLFLYALS